MAGDGENITDMIKKIYKWITEKWKSKTNVGKAGIGATFYVVLNWLKDAVFWVLDAPSRWHQLMEWVKNIPNIHLRYYPWINPIIFLAGILLLRLGNKKESTPKKIIPSPTPLPARIISAPPVPVPKPVDLRGEIVEFWVQQSLSVFGSPSGYDVYINLRITNHGPQEVTVIGWKLRIEVGSYGSTGNTIPIPPALQVKRKDPSAFGYIEKSGPLTSLQCEGDIYKTGIPRFGWLAFHVWTDYAFPYNGHFKITATDSLNGEHLIQRIPQMYMTDIEIIHVPDTAPKM
jgi:hypothetical protein